MVEENYCTNCFTIFVIGQLNSVEIIQNHCGLVNEDILTAISRFNK